MLEADTFQTRARNWLDHSNIGESNLFWPLTWDGALIQGWETHAAFAAPLAPRASPPGLLESDRAGAWPIHRRLDLRQSSRSRLRAAAGILPVDHDQRNTLNLGFNATLPWQAFASTNVYYGSGFTNGIPDAQYPGNYLPQHTTFDISLGKAFGEKYSVGFTALNVANRRVLLDNSLTFGGFHYNDPRQIYVEFRWRFHY